MARYADGDAEAFDELFSRYEGPVFAYFARRVRPSERARDLYQELFLRVHRARDRFDPARPFAPWLFQIAHRLLVDDQRRAWRAHEVPLAPDAQCAAPEIAAEDRLAARERLGRGLASLSPAERAALLGSRVEGIGYPELAARLGKSVEAVRKLVSRATQRLRTANPAPAKPVRLRSR